MQPPARRLWFGPVELVARLAADDPLSREQGATFQWSNLLARTTGVKPGRPFCAPEISFAPTTPKGPFPFAQIPLESTGLSGTAYKILIALHKGPGSFRPNRPAIDLTDVEIARRVGRCSVATVQRGLRELIRGGWIGKRKRHGRRWLKRLYTLAGVKVHALIKNDQSTDQKRSAPAAPSQTHPSRRQKETPSSSEAKRDDDVASLTLEEHQAAEPGPELSAAPAPSREGFTATADPVLSMDPAGGPDRLVTEVMLHSSDRQATIVPTIANPPVGPPPAAVEAAAAAERPSAVEAIAELTLAVLPVALGQAMAREIRRDWREISGRIGGRWDWFSAALCVIAKRLLDKLPPPKNPVGYAVGIIVTDFTPAGDVTPKARAVEAEVKAEVERIAVAKRAELARRAAARASPESKGNAAELAKEAMLRALWEHTPETDRQRISDQVEAENPGLRRGRSCSSPSCWPSWRNSQSVPLASPGRDHHERPHGHRRRGDRALSGASPVD